LGHESIGSIGTIARRAFASSAWAPDIALITRQARVSKLFQSGSIPV